MLHAISLIKVGSHRGIRLTIHSTHFSYGFSVYLVQFVNIYSCVSYAISLIKVRSHRGIRLTIHSTHFSYGFSVYLVQFG